MTEAEAKTKWCPFARVAGCEGVSGNRHILSADGMNGADKCIASDCMAWRTASQRVPDPADDKLTITVRDGYCGLAGGAA